MPRDRDELLRRLAGGQWLTSGDAATVLRVHRRTIKNMLDDGRLSWRWHPAGRIREINPASLKVFLDATATVQRGRTARIEPTMPTGPTPPIDEDVESDSPAIQPSPNSRRRR